MKLYGLKNCDSCKKAIKELSDAGHRIDFFDFSRTPLEYLQVVLLLKRHGETILLNRKSTAWRKLEKDSRDLMPLDLLRQNPTLFKRPIIYDGAVSYVGWTNDVKAALGA